MKNIFKKQIIDCKLINRNGERISGDLLNELKDLKSEYTFTAKSGNRFYKYSIIENTLRSPFCNKLGITKYDKITYTIITHFIHNGEPIQFDTDNLICMGSQIDVQMMMIFGEIF